MRKSDAYQNSKYTNERPEKSTYICTEEKTKEYPKLKETQTSKENDVVVIKILTHAILTQY